jgi:hypothetical protein
MSRRTSGFAAAVLTAAAAYATLLAPTPAAAAGQCSGADGVTVVVDFHDLGGGLQQACDVDGGGRDAASLFVRAGYQLTTVQKQPAFVCRVNGVPADDPCVNTPPADAYWTLWWSDGTDGRWSYSTVAASGLKIPDGGYVAFSWNRGSGQDKPGVAPKAHVKASSTPTPSPSAKPTPTPTSPLPPSPTGQLQPTPTATPTPSHSRTPQAPSAATTSDEAATTKATVAGTPTPTAASEPAAPAAQDQEPVVGGDSLAGETAAAVPAWAVLIVIAALLAGAAGIAAVRRGRQEQSPP